MKNRDIGAVLKKLNAMPETKAIKLPSINGYLESGTPDVLIITGGRPILIEVKHGKEIPSPIQAKRAEQWRAAGATVAICRTAAEIMALVASACARC